MKRKEKLQSQFDGDRASEFNWLPKAFFIEQNEKFPYH